MTRDAQRLAAGLKEDEEAARVAAGFDPHLCADLRGVHHTTARARRDIAAKRQILALYEEFAAELDRQLADPACKAAGPGIRTGTEVLGQVVKALAGVYQDAPAETGA